MFFYVKLSNCINFGSKLIHFYSRWIHISLNNFRSDLYLAVIRSDFSTVDGRKKKKNSFSRPKQHHVNMNHI